MKQQFAVRAENRVNPLGIQNPSPVFTYTLPFEQTACRVIVGTRPDGAELWDSGVLEIEKPLFIRYEGKKLSSKTLYHYTIFARDERGGWHGRHGTFETALFEREDWRGAKWICHPDAAVQNPILFKKFSLSAVPARARIYLSGLGLFELFVNGQRVGDEVLTPYNTAYQFRVLYCCYDITALLKSGENELRVSLGNGWMRLSHANAWGHETAPFKDQPKLLALCEITGEDGGETAIPSDPTWQTLTGPIVENDFYVGEVHDYTAAPGDPKPAHWAKTPGGVLRAMEMPAEKIISRFACTPMRTLDDGSLIVDVGGGTSGYVRLTVNGQKGQRFTVTHSEKLAQNGDLDQSNIAVYVTSDVFQQDTYILGEDGVQELYPRFTYHGFRYAKIRGDISAVTAIECCVTHTALETTGEFSCSKELINQIQAAVLNSTLTNFHGMPTDCPHREKNGWTGDAALSAEHSLQNFEMQQAYRKYMEDMVDLQLPDGTVSCIAPTAWWGYTCGLNGPAWDVAVFSIPYETYEHTGSTELLRRCYPMMQRYLRHIAEMSADGICCYGLGDWCPPTGGWDCWRYDIAVTDTGYHYQMLQIAAKTAELLGKTRESAAYTAEAARVKDAFVRHFWHEDTGKVDNGTQTTQLAALYFGFLDDAQAEKALQVLLDDLKARDYHHDLGILGAKYLFKVLCSRGCREIAYRMATSTEFPSWGLWIRNGHKTLLETWNEDSSQNHHMFGSIGAYFYNELAGLRLGDGAPGYREIVFAPQPVGDLTSARAIMQTPNGTAAIDWRLCGDKLTVRLTVPFGSTATLLTPDGFCAHKPAALRGGEYAFVLKKH